MSKITQITSGREIKICFVSFSVDSSCYQITPMTNHHFLDLSRHKIHFNGQKSIELQKPDSNDRGCFFAAALTKFHTRNRKRRPGAQWHICPFPCSIGLHRTLVTISQEQPLNTPSLSQCMSSKTIRLRFSICPKTCLSGSECRWELLAHPFIHV